MPYRICKTIEIENGHMLSKHPDKCQFPHGHTRKVELILEADSLDSNEMVCDFKLIKQLIGEYLDSFDHAMCMNTQDPQYATFKAAYGDRVIGFENEDPTTEVLAREFFHFFQQALSDHSSSTEAKDNKYPLRNEVRLVSVRVWETSSSWAEYFLN